MARNTRMESYVQAWWFWFAVALFLLLPLDMLTTLAAVAEYGVIVEANPVKRSLLDHGLLAVTVGNLIATVLVVVLFHAVVEWIRHSSSTDRRLFVPVVTGWLVILNGAGILVVGNNLSIWFS